jgi:hypothetical protein
MKKLIALALFAFALNLGTALIHTPSSLGYAQESPEPAPAPEPAPKPESD